MKLHIAVAAITDSDPDYMYWVPTDIGVIHSFKAPKSIALSVYKDSEVLIPYQLRDQDMNDEIKFLSQLKSTGWDWKAEPLKRVELGNIIVYALNPNQRIHEVEDIIKKSNRVLREIHIEPAEFDRASKFHYQRPGKSPVVPHSSTHYVAKPTQPLHGRTRFLWKMHHTKFSAWEQKFVKDIGEQLRVGKPLTQKQDEHLGRLFTKYQVRLDATASD